MPPKILEYHTCKAFDSMGLDEQVMFYLNKGWQPYWRQSVIHDEHSMKNVYTQVMVKYEGKIN